MLALKLSFILYSKKILNENWCFSVNVYCSFLPQIDLNVLSMD